MKQGIHPQYKPTVFVDANTGAEFVTRSTKNSGQTKEIDGVEHQVITMEITSDTHPFWTGKVHRIDSAGRIERFNKRFGDQIVGGKRKTRKSSARKAED